MIIFDSNRKSFDILSDGRISKFSIFGFSPIFRKKIRLDLKSEILGDLVRARKNMASVNIGENYFLIGGDVSFGYTRVRFATRFLN